MKTIRALAWGNLCTFIVHITLSYLTQFKIINTKDVGEVSDQFPSLFTPSGGTFAIWGLIYVLLGLLCIYHLIISYSKSPEHPANGDLSNMGGWFMVNNLVTATWLLAWTHEQIGFSVLLILIQLISLIVIHKRLHIYQPQRTVAHKIFTAIPLSIYFGWITVATVSNIAIYLVSIGWKGGGISEITWAQIMIIVVAVIALVVITTRKNIWYGFVVMWGLNGIINKRTAIDAFGYAPVINIAWGAIGALGAACLWQLIKNIAMSRSVVKQFPEAKHSLK